MRYFVLVFSDVVGIAPLICGEVVYDGTDLDADRLDSLAGTIAGPRSAILTREELLADPEGRHALQAWDERDDAEFDKETIALAAERDDPGGVVLTLVRSRRRGGPVALHPPHESGEQP